jgi:murein L,D-transpeptidase YafK
LQGYKWAKSSPCWPYFLLLPLTSCSSSASEQAQNTPLVKQQLLGSPVYIQIFKEERKLELFAKVQDKYQLVQSFNICKFSVD